MKIAICEDEKTDLAHLTAILHRYQENTGIELEIFPFTRSDDVFSAVREGIRFDLIFFDILMHGPNGMEAAQVLRTIRPDLPLVFTTVSRDFAVEAFSVKARDYLLKPIEESAVAALLAGLEIDSAQQESLVLASRSGIRKIRPDQLVYCEVLGHTVFWHLSSGAVVETVGSMQKTMKLLEGYDGFFQVHRAFLIHFAYLSELRKSDFTVELHGMSRLAVPKARFKTVVEAYKRYMKKRGGAQ